LPFLLASLLATAAWSAGPASAAARGGESTASTSAANAWSCRSIGRRDLGARLVAGRGLLRALRATSRCAIRRPRYELCEPVHARMPTGAGIESDESRRELATKLCVRIDCRPGAPTVPVALDDSLGRRAVTPLALDRLCTDID
jgi:hypothetical protein